MSGRENILKRVQAALATTAPKHFEHGAPSSGTPWYLPVGEGFDALCARFTEELSLLKGDFFHVANAEDANVLVKELLAKNNFATVAAQDATELRTVLDGIPVKWLGSDVAGGCELGRFDLGVTVCDALVAQTGSVILTAKSAGGRAISVLPPNHLVVAKRAQLLPDLPSAFRMLKEKYGEKFPSMVNVTTGPSRTSDIEKMLVMGAHGPKKLFVVLVG